MSPQRLERLRSLGFGLRELRWPGSCPTSFLRQGRERGEPGGVLTPQASCSGNLQGALRGWRPLRPGLGPVFPQPSPKLGCREGAASSSPPLPLVFSFFVLFFLLFLTSLLFTVALGSSLCHLSSSSSEPPPLSVLGLLRTSPCPQLLH